MIDHQKNQLKSKKKDKGQDQDQMKGKIRKKNIKSEIDPEAKVDNHDLHINVLHKLNI